mmetsp:Transcript_30411/g.60840  ORF Transcript_30411/g.60840 Transcript_30411/m.60840 type:complete len:391 (+) Transcript_30411:177-1349(+)
MKTSIPRRSRPSSGAESSATGDGATKPSSEPSLLSGMAPPPPDATLPQSHQHGKKHQNPQQQHQIRSTPSSGPKSTPQSEKHPAELSRPYGSIRGSNESAKTPNANLVVIASSSALALPAKQNMALSALEQRAVKHLDELIDNVSSSLVYETNVDQITSRDYKSKKGPSIDMVGNFLFGFYFSYYAEICSRWIILLKICFNPVKFDAQFGSFITNSDNKYDFFDTDPTTGTAKFTPLPNTRIPVFPEDFPPNGQKEWPLKWWGIVKPTDELLDLHDEKVTELGYEVPSKRRRTNSPINNSSNAQASDNIVIPEQKIGGQQRRDVGIEIDQIYGRGEGNRRHDFRGGRERINNYRHSDDLHFNHPGDVRRPPDNGMDNNWRHGPDRGRRAK